MEEKKQEWESFVKTAKIKTGNHTRMVRFYNSINNTMILSVILLSGILTCAVLLGGISKIILGALGGSCTVLTATSKFLVADRKKAGHKRFAKLFQTLLIRMVRCQTLVEYNSLWHELHEGIIKEPLVLICRRQSKKTKITYSMDPRLAQAFEGKSDSDPINTGTQLGYKTPMNYGLNELYQHEFHVIPSNNQPPIQQVPNRHDGYVAISGFEENPTRTVTNDHQEKNAVVEQIPEEQMPCISSPRKNRKKKTKTDNEKSLQCRQFYLGNSSQGTLDEIEEEQVGDIQNIPETSGSFSLTERRNGKQKNDQNSQSKSPPQQDLPLPPPPMEEDDDEYFEQKHQMFQTEKITSSPSKYARGRNKNDRSIVYDEEEENDLSEDTDDLDEKENVSYTRN